MASERRIGSEDSETRERLLDVAEELLRTEGHVAVTVRKLAAEAGLKRQLVHYYFRSMEELFLEILDRAYARHFERHEEALKAENPLRGLWEAAFYPEDIFFEVYSMVLANQFESVRASLAEFLKRSREMQVRALRRIIEEFGDSREMPEPEALAIFLRGTAREIALERKIGMEMGHPEAVAAVERYLSFFDKKKK